MDLAAAAQQLAVSLSSAKSPQVILTLRYTKLVTEVAFMSSPRISTRNRVSRYRERMRRLGFRQVNVWLLDTRSPAFAKECRRQSRLASKADRKRALSAELERTATEIEGWTK